jgi:rod shape-determining protein MreC
MKNLINFLKRFRDILIFFILQVIVLSIFFNSKNYHKTSFINTSSAVSSWITEKRNDITKHFSLEDENKLLMEKNAKLMTYQPYSFYHLQNRIYSVNDTLYEQQYEYIPASVIKTSVNRRDNYITIDKGALQNIQEGMGVITNNGIVGFVVNVSPHYALIKTILSERLNIAAKLKKQSDVRGQIKWDGKDYKTVQLHGITNDIKINKGDKIVTKGSRGVFPQGITIGQVEGVSSKNGEITLDIEVELSTDFKRLNTVYIVRNLFKTEQDQLEKGFFDE